MLECWCNQYLEIKQNKENLQREIEKHQSSILNIKILEKDNLRWHYSMNVSANIHVHQDLGFRVKGLGFRI